MVTAVEVLPRQVDVAALHAGVEGRFRRGEVALVLPLVVRVGDARPLAGRLVDVVDRRP